MSESRATEENFGLAEIKKVLDPQLALDRMGGDGEILVSLLDLFATELPSIMSSIRVAAASHDGPALNRAAHRLKGSVSVFGAEAAAGAALRLETMAREGTMGDIRGAQAELEKEIARLEPALVQFRTQLLSSGFS